MINLRSNAAKISGGDQYVIVEGNYLLLDQEDWRDLSQFWGYSVFVEADFDELERRLIEVTGSAAEIVEKTENWNLNAKILEDWLAEAVPAVTRMITGAISIIDFPAVLIDGNLPTDLREVLVDRITKELKNENLAGLVAPQIIEGSLGPKARPMGAVSLPLAKRYMLEA